MEDIEQSSSVLLQPTDVAQFFIDIIEEYLLFEQSILHLLSSLPTCNHRKILLECEKLRGQRDQLAILDLQLIAIIDLAGIDIAKTHMVHDYRAAFTKALVASNELYQELLVVKATLLNDLHSVPPESL